MANQELKSLREQILAEIVPLVIDNESGVDQFSLLLRIIQAGGASSEIYNRAHESAKRIEDKSERLEALLSLIDEIDIDARQVDDEAGDGAQYTQEDSVDENSSAASDQAVYEDNPSNPPQESPQS